MAKYTNLQQVAFVEKALAEGWKYWYGCVGYPATDSLYKRKKAQYPEHYGSSRTATYKKHIAEKCMVADCVGLIKAFFWSGGGTTENRYASNNCPDRSANGMYQMCKKTGPIRTISSTPGLVVWNKGHIGVSLDGVWAIEARGFNYGVTKTRIRDRKWTNWGQLPASMLDYVTAGSYEPETPEIPANKGCPYTEPTKNLKKGAKGNGVRWIQWMLTGCGYSVGRCGIDGDFGSDTRAAVRKFQRENRLSVDAIVGPLTRAALKTAYEKKEEAK